MDNVGGTVTFQPGSNLQGFQTADGAVKRPMIFKGNNLIGSGNGTIATINSDMQLDGNVTLQSLASGAAANNNNPLELKGAITGVGGITKVGLNSVTLSGAQTYAGATAVTGGTLLIGGNSTGSSSLSVSDGATVQLKAGSNVTLKAGSLNLNASGKLDLADGKLVIGTTTPDQLTTYIAAGRNGGSWNAAAGLTTSNSLDSLHGIGFAPANVAGVTTWGAATGLTTETVVGIAAYGDLNMDGKVNADDYVRLDRGNAKHLTGWFNGDVDYSGAVDSADYLLVDTSFVDTGIPHDAVLALLAQREAQFGPDYVSQLLAAVPEPSAAPLLLAAGGILAKRRRK
jgi:autotransporter-associated beta strand protein